MYEIHDFNHLDDTYRLSQCVEDETLAYRIFSDLSRNGFQVQLINATTQEILKEVDMNYAINAKRMSLMAVIPDDKIAINFAKNCVQQGVECYIMDSPNHLKPFSDRELGRLYQAVTLKRLVAHEREEMVDEVMSALYNQRPTSEIDMPKVDKIEPFTNDEIETDATEVTDAVSTEVEKPKRTTRPRVPKDATITVLAESNPKRAGSASYDRFELYRDGMTVQEFVDAGGRVADIHFDTARNFISLSDGDDGDQPDAA